MQYLWFLVFALAIASPVLALWPIPRSLQTGNTTLKLSGDFKINLDFRGAPQDLQEAVSRTSAFLQNDKLGRLVVGRGESDQATVQNAKQLRSLSLSLGGTSRAMSVAEEAVLPLGTRSEEYTLRVPSDGSTATLLANSTLGLFRGLTTFEQLWYYLDGEIYMTDAPISITDSPAYVSEAVSDIYVLAKSIHSLIAGLC